MRGGMRRRPWRRGNRTSAARGAPPPLDRGVLGTCVDRRTMLRITGGAAVVLPLAACGDADAAPNTLRISYQQFGSGTIMRDYLTGVMEAYSTRHPDVTVELVPLVAAEEDYFTKNELMMSSPRTTPDLVYEDTFILQSDVAAGYLRPIDDFIAGWDNWEHFYEPGKEAVTGQNGKVYAVPTHTDTRGLWYNQDLFEQAGLSVPWRPSTWTDILDAMRTLKDELPDVIPINVYSGKPQGEKASMQGFEMLLYGTDDRLYDAESETWVLGSQGFLDSLEFLRTIFSERLTPGIGQALDPNLSELVQNTWMPEGRVAVNLDGSWISSSWVEGGAAEWPEWPDVIDVAPMPTQDGSAPGVVSLAGGWSWAIPQLSSKPDLAWSFLEEMMSTDNMAGLAVADNQVTIRSDVADHPDYQGYSPTIDFFTELVDKAEYRPALAPYPQVSAAIQAAMETVMTGQGTPEQAQAAYDADVRDIVGPENTSEAS
ncbi:extracellular solute-binding protein [Georgenia deserti]|uniref:Extracellular solute-binding protein n=1 Tax=Georgenia deserti TaxID=2093781 RepID=A0ABW4L261_9MICO